MAKRPKRRANGSGSVYAVGGGFKGQYAVGRHANGRVKYRYVSAPTKRECEEKLQDAMYRHRHGDVVTDSSDSLERYLNGWVRDRATPRVAAHTASGYQNAVNRICTHIGDVQLCDLRPAHIQNCYAHLAQTYAAATVAVDHQVLSMALEDAVGWELIARNPCRYADPPRLERIERTVLSREECGRLFAAEGDLQYRALWMVLAVCGLRFAEATSLRWQDVGESALAVHGTKTEAAEREAPLTADVATALKAHRAEQRLRIMANRDIYEDESLVFATADGRQLHNGTVRDAFHRRLKAAGLPPMRVHDLRRTAIALLREAGVEIDVVQRVVGHANIATTVDTYGTINRKRIAEAGRLLDGYLKEGS